MADRIRELEPVRRKGRGKLPLTPETRTRNITVKVDEVLLADLAYLKEYYGQREYAPVVRMAIKALVRQTKGR